MIFAIVNQSTAPELAAGSTVVAMASDLQDAYDQAFAPAWGVLPVDVRVAAASDLGVPAPGVEPIRVLRILDVIDGSDGMLADHYVDDAGRPTMELSVTACRRVPGNILDVISEAASHELFECARNPSCRLYLDATPVITGKKPAAEVCDPVQGSPWKQGKTTIANFVLPAWEEPNDKVGPFDYVSAQRGQRILSSAFECYPSGYLAFDDGSQHFGDKVTDERRAQLEASARIMPALWST
jgi:hypothetical protein